MSGARGPFQRGLDAYGEGAFPEAVRAFEEALDQHPESALVLGALGLARMKGGDLAGAREALERAEALGPSSEVAYHRGLVEMSAERYEAALEAFEQAEARGGAGDPVRVGKGACLALLGEAEGARELLEDLAAPPDGDPEALYWYAVACAGERDRPGRRDQALTRLQALIGRHEGVSDWLRGRAHFLLASLLDDAEEGYEEAVEHYHEGLAYDPEFVIGRNNLGAVYLSQGRHAEARAELLRAMAQQPTYRRVHGNLARLYYDKAGEEELREDLGRLIQELPRADATEALFGLILALMDETRGRAFRDFYDRGHSLKNLLALLGSRLKRLQRRLPEGEDLEAALAELKGQYDEVYTRLAGDLRLTRPQAEQLHAIDVNAVTRKVARRVRREAGEGLEVRLELRRDVPLLFGDVEAFQEAVLNLARNAVEAMAGRGRLALTTRLVDEGRRVGLEVLDDGPGLPPGHAEDIFKSGFTTKESGSGVGLALVRRVVQELHGTVVGEDAPGGGARFRVQVPAEVRYHPSRGLGLAARPVRLDEYDELNVDELA